jgi:hypothetical protein
MNISPIKWSPCRTNFNGPLLAWHSACLVLPSEIANHPRTNIYNLPEEKIGKRLTNKVNINFFYYFNIDKRERNLYFWRKI